MKTRLNDSQALPGQKKAKTNVILNPAKNFFFMRILKAKLVRNALKSWKTTRSSLPSNAVLRRHALWKIHRWKKRTRSTKQQRRTRKLVNFCTILISTPAVPFVQVSTAFQPVMNHYHRPEHVQPKGISISISISSVEFVTTLKVRILSVRVIVQERQSGCMNPALSSGYVIQRRSNARYVPVPSLLNVRKNPSNR